MYKAKILIITPLLIFSSLLGIPFGHAVTGQAVCINTSAATDCSTSASFVSTAFTVGSQLVVNVNVQSSPSINGFDVQVLTDPTLLRAASISFGSVIAPPPFGNVLVECLDGVLVLGQTCTNTDGLGVTHLGLVQSGSSTTAPTTGTLFSITYNIVGAGGPATIGFQTGCSGTTSSPNACVTLLAGLNNPPTVTLVTASFANLNDFSLAIHTASSATSTAFSDTSTSITPGSTGTSTLNLKALGLFSNTVNLVTTPSAGLAASTGASSFALSNGGSASTTLSYSSATPGTYTVTVAGTAMTGGQSHSVTLSVLVSVSDFSTSANPTALTVAPGSSGTSTITVGPISGFSSTVGLTASVSGITATLSSNSIPNAAGTSTLTVNVATGTTGGPFTVTVTGMSGVISHAAQVVVTVPPPDFDLIPQPNEVDAPVGVAVSSVISVDSLNNFAGTVALTATVAGAGTVGPATPLTSSLSFSSLALTAGSTLTSTVVVGTPATASLGNYTITIKGTSGSLTHTTSVFFILEDFSANLTKHTMLVYPGASCTPVCKPGHRDIAFWETTSLGGNLGFGFSTGGGSPVGSNCRRFIVSFVQATLLCIDFDIFFANGTQATQSQVLSGLVPIVTLPRFQFPVPTDSPLCTTLDDGGLQDLFSGSNPGTSAANPFTGDPVPAWVGHCIGDDFGIVRARAFPFTLPGTYKVHVLASASVLVHDLGFITITVPQPPELNQLQFKPHLSLSKDGNAQSFRLGITNNNNATTLSVIIRVSGIASDKITTISLVSAVQTLAPLQTINNIFLTAPLSAASVGLTFTISVTLQWGVPPFSLTARSHPDISGFPNSGSFTVFP